MLRTLKSFRVFNGGLAQLARATALHAVGQRFDSVILHNEFLCSQAKQSGANVAICITKMKQILEGWAKMVAKKFNQLDQDSQDLASSRLCICDSCEMRLGSICDPTKVAPHAITGNLTRGCGCSLAAKTLVKGARCPLGKW